MSEINKMIYCGDNGSTWVVNFNNFIEKEKFEKLQKEIQIMQKIQKKKNWIKRRK